MVSVLHLFAAFAAAFAAGAINSVAGGGSMISFPTLLALGLPPILANATSTLGIWPGAIGSLYGFRRELKQVPKRMAILLGPAACGALIGALLLRRTPESVFAKLVPGLILFATVLFLIQPAVQKLLRLEERMLSPTRAWKVTALVLQFFVAVYGGYFGAGISIMMLSLLGMLGMIDILEMSAMTSLLSFTINGVAILIFILGGMIAWPFALVMAIGAIMGGYLAAGAARKVGKLIIRRFVVTVGLTISAVLFYRMLVY